MLLQAAQYSMALVAMVSCRCISFTSKYYTIDHAENCTNGDVRLVGRSDDYEGNVQVCISGTWGYVCDTNWDSNDATVVCKQLGYSTSRKSHAYKSLH